MSQEYPEKDNYEDREMVDFVWALIYAQFTWAFKEALLGTLHYIPKDFEDYKK